jgi:hypothetical protein
MEKEIQENGEIEDDTVVFKNQEELVVPAFVHGIVSFIEKIDSTSIVVVWTLEKHIQGAKTTEHSLKMTNERME